jgi:hypothetical protein
MLNNDSYKRQTAHLEHAGAEPGTRNIHDTYVVDEHNTPVTVVGTYGQDPDHKPKIPWKSWAILALCSLAQMQNVFMPVFFPSLARLLGPTRAPPSGALIGLSSSRVQWDRPSLQRLLDRGRPRRNHLGAHLDCAGCWGSLDRDWPYPGYHLGRLRPPLRGDCHVACVLCGGDRVDDGQQREWPARGASQINSGS